MLNGAVLMLHSTIRPGWRCSGLARGRANPVARQAAGRGAVQRRGALRRGHARPVGARARQRRLQHHAVAAGVAPRG